MLVDGFAFSTMAWLDLPSLEDPYAAAMEDYARRKLAKAGPVLVCMFKRTATDGEVHNNGSVRLTYATVVQ